MTQPTPDLPAPLGELCIARPHPKGSQRKPSGRYAAAMHQALRDYGEGDVDPGTGSDYGDQTAVALAVRDEEMDLLRADLNTCRDRHAVSADNALTEIRRLEAELVAARSTIDRVSAATDALATQAGDFTSHHNPACECSWGEALDQAAARIRAALAEQPETTP